jgi:hypothetical protein
VKRMIGNDNSKGKGSGKLWMASVRKGGIWIGSEEQCGRIEAGGSGKRSRGDGILVLDHQHNRNLDR